MKKQFSILILSIFFITNLNAQDIEKSTYLYFTPTTLVSNYPILRFGIEEQINEKHAILFEAGFGANTNKNHPYSRFQIRGTYKYILSKKETENKVYLFADVFYNSVTIRHNTVFSFSNISETFTYDKCIEKINKPGFNIGLGYFIRLSDRFKLDFCLGFGEVKRTISYSNKVNELITYHQDDHSIFGKIDNEGTTKTLSSKAGISLVYKITQ